MKPRGLDLFSLGRVRVAVDWSWLLVFALVTASLALGYLPGQHPGSGVLVYWGVAAVVALPRHGFGGYPVSWASACGSDGAPDSPLPQRLQSSIRPWSCEARQRGRTRPSALRRLKMRAVADRLG
jgi:hypothetical protein